MTQARIRLDPWITTAESAVSIDEMVARHTPPSQTSAEGLTVIVQDSGLDATHPRIEKNTRDTTVRDFSGAGKGDAVGHGTATADMATRYATGAHLRAHRVFGQTGSNSGFSPFRQSFEYAIKHADEIIGDGPPVPFNMSWGTSRKVPEIDNYVNELARVGYIPVAAAGNTGGSTGSPATAKYCISVGALQEMGKRMTNFSSWDQDSQEDPGFAGVPEVAAIGKNCVLARASGTSMGRVVDSDTVVASGTSFAAPFVTGVVLDLVRRRGWDAKRMLHELEASVNDIPGTARDGLGRVNWQAATNRRDKGENGRDGNGESQTAEATVYSPPWSDEDWVHVDADVLDDGEYEADLKALEAAFQ